MSHQTKSEKPTAEQVRTLKRRVDAAFRALKKQGVFCRRNFLCCQSCGTAAVPDGTPYVFWHGQDEDGLRESGTVRLAFGAPGKDGKTVTLGRIIVSAMKAAGVRAVWDGNPDKRIRLEVADA